MPKKKRPEEDPKKQFERFVETAREHGLNESKAEKRFKRLAETDEASRPPLKSAKPR